MHLPDYHYCPVPSFSIRHFSNLLQYFSASSWWPRHSSETRDKTCADQGLHCFKSPAYLSEQWQGRREATHIQYLHIAAWIQNVWMLDIHVAVVYACVHSIQLRVYFVIYMTLICSSLLIPKITRVQERSWRVHIAVHLLLVQQGRSTSSRGSLWLCDGRLAGTSWNQTLLDDCYQANSERNALSS